ncbi:MAG TPA: PAS domain S-box protein [Acetobacteraceae bacterium]|nr:PAS domain S-box protein [Acetobacteraceae bacterium]
MHHQIDLASPDRSWPGPRAGEHIAVANLDAEGRITLWNAGATRLTGWAEAEVLGQPHDILFPPAARAAGRPAAVMRAALSQGAHVEEGERLGRDGRPLPLQASLVALRDQAGRPVGLTLMLRPLDHRAAPAAGLWAVLDAAGDAVLMLDAEGRVGTANAATARLLGVADPAGQPLSALLGRDGPPERLAGQAVPVRRPDGTRRLLDIAIGACRGEDGAACCAVLLRDVSERDGAGRTLRDAETRWRGLMETAPISIVVLDIETRAILDFNDLAAQQLGYSREEFARLTMWDIEVASPAEVEARMRHRARSPNGRLQFTTRHRTRDGALRDILVTSTRIECCGRVAAQSAWLDITERRRAEAALAASEERLRLAVEGAGLATWDMVMGEETVLWSPNHFRILGHEVDPDGRATVAMWRDRIHPEDLAAAMAEWERAEHGDGRWHLTYRARRLDGGTIWLEGHGRILPRPEGGRRFIGVLKDITAERRAQEALAEAEERLRLALEGAELATWDLVVGEDPCIWSERLFELLGYPPDPAGRATTAMWMSRVHPDDLARAMGDLREAAARGGSFRTDYRIRRPDGTELVVEEHGRVRTLPDGRKRCLGIVRDVTAERAARAALAESEERLRFALGTAGFATWDRILGEDDTTLWSPEHYALLGLPLDPSGRADMARFRARVHPEDAPRLRQDVARAGEGDGRFFSSFRYMHEGGAWIWLDAHGRLLPMPDGRRRFIGMVRDVTEARQAEEALRSSETRLRLALESTGAGLWEFDVRSARSTVDARWLATLGLPEGTEMDFAWWEALIHPEDLPRMRALIGEQIAGGVAVVEADYRMRHRDGHWVWVNAHALVAERDAAGRATRILGISRDITRRKTAEAALEAGEARLRAVVDAVPECVMVLDPDARLVSLNAAGLRMLGAPSEAALTDGPVLRFVAEEDREAWIAAHRRICAGERLDHEFGALTPDGRALRLATTGVPIRLGDGRTGQLAVARDVTRRREAEAQLATLRAEAMRASRIGAVGAMAAGLAHELNQPLGAMANYAGAARLMLDRLAVEEGAEELRGRIRAAVEAAGTEAVRAGDIVRRLRDFVGRAEGELAITPVALLVAQAAGDAAALPGLPLQVEASVDPLAGDIFADAVQIRQVLANLLRNAAEAMQGQDERRVTLRAARVPEGVEFAVSDTGPGLPPGAAARLFEPFASAKPGGMGIGLAICRTIVEAHGGRIRADAPEPGRGATFRFVIPDADAAMGED